LIPPKTIEEIKSTAKIEEVVEDFLNLKRRGVNMLGLCPFHDEKTPSFTVSPSKNIYKCFGCGRAGDSVSFIMDHEGYSYTEALRYLAKKYSIPIEEQQLTPELLNEKLIVDSYYLINEYAKNQFSENLFSSSEGKNIGLSYFKSRGYVESTIKKFDLGYALSDGKDFISKALKSNYKKEYLESLGLASKSGYDFFRERVMFTIHSISGKPIGFAGRTLKSDKSQPKYINSPESEIYNKRKVLYGLYFAKTAIRKEDECILVEGYTDVISLHQAGIENVVASSGTALTIEQIKLVKRYTENILIIYDGDSAGINAALRGLDLILEQGLNVKLVLLPTGEDPDSSVKNMGYEKFKQYLADHAEDFILFKTRIMLEEAGNDPIKRTRLIKDIVDSISKIPDTLKRSVYIQECSRRLNVDEEILVKSTNSKIRSEIKNRQKQSNPDMDYNEETALIDKQYAVSQTDRYTKGDEFQELDIIRILVTLGHKIYDEESNTTVAEYVLANLNGILDNFDNELYQRVVNYVLETTKNGRNLVPNDFITHEDEPLKNLAITLLSEEYSYASWENKGVMLQTQKPPDENFIKDSYQAILRFKLKKVLSSLEKIEKEINTTEDTEKLKTLIQVFNHLQQERNQVARELNTVVL